MGSFLAGPFATAQVGSVYAPAFLGPTKLLVADTTYSYVRQLDLTTNTLTNIAGACMASAATLNGLCLQGSLH